VRCSCLRTSDVSSPVPEERGGRLWWDTPREWKGGGGRGSVVLPCLALRRATRSEASVRQRRYLSRLSSRSYTHIAQSLSQSIKQSSTQAINQSINRSVREGVQCLIDVLVICLTILSAFFLRFSSLSSDTAHSSSSYTHIAQH
jgi:hypothetical protein